MFNPAAAMKVMSAKNKFVQNHPKFVAFVKNELGNGLPEGSVVELTVTKPGQQPVKTNIRVLQSDLDFINEIKNIK